MNIRLYTVFAVAILAAGCTYLEKMEADAGAEFAAQEQAAASLYQRLGKFSTALESASPTA